MCVCVCVCVHELGCYHQADSEKCLSPQSSVNSIDSNDTLHGTCIANTSVVYDSVVVNSNKKTKIASSLHSAAEATVDSSVAQQLCLYTCDMCSCQFAAGSTLRRHRRRHKNCATCTECGHSFYSADVLRHHSLMQCTRKSVTCDVCQESFNGWPSLSRHTTAAHPAAYVCQLCGQAFLHLDQLVTHRSVHTTKSYQCRTCAESFRSRRRVKRHIRKHVADTEDACISESQVNQGNGDVSSFESWLNDVNSDGCFSEYNLNEVIKETDVSYQQKVFTEAACVSESRVEESAVSQLDHANSLAHRFLPLQLPGYTLPATVDASNEHVDGHRIIMCFNEQPLPNCVSMADPLEGGAAVSQERVKCAECSRTFKRVPDLHVHMQCHTGEMRYKCSVCSRPFRKSGTLARHMRIHTGERPYICETCGKSYKLLFHLQLHMTVHSADRLFSCDVCGKAFQSAASLKKHRFVHSGVKPFSCPICTRLFNRRSNMRAHMRVHDGARQHEVFGQEHICILCRKKFGSTASLQAHLQTHAQQIVLDVGETVAIADDSVDSTSKETSCCKVEKQETEDVYVAWPLVHFDAFDVG